MYYVQRNALSQPLETVDQFEKLKEAREMLMQYRLADPSADYYLSTRACRDWRES
jgi:hypothetical protein